MQFRRPKTVLLLIVVFAWSFLKDTEVLVRWSNGADRILYDEIGIGWLFVSVLSVIALLDLAAARYLIKPAPIGRLICLASIGLSAVQTLIAFAVARAHPDVARRAFIVSRESRGLPVRVEAIETAVNPTTLLLLMCGSLALSGVFAFLVIRNTSYFFSKGFEPPSIPLQSTNDAGKAS